MGVIKRQGIKQSIVTYVGIVIGMLNMLWIYATFLTPEELGLIKFLQSTAIFILPFVFLGSSNLIIRFFPEFQDEERKHNGFLSFLILLVGSGYMLFLLVAFLLKDVIIDYYAAQSNFLIIQYLPHLVVLVLIAAFNLLFTIYIINFKRIVVPAIFNDLFLKIAVPILVVLYYFEYLSFNQLIGGLIGTYFIILLALIAYLRSLGQLHLGWTTRLLTKNRLRRMGVYMGFGVLGNLGNKLANQIDIIMVASLMDLRYTGIYTMAFTISTVVEVPRRALSKIISPIMANALKSNDFEEVKMLYQKSALNQFIVGLYIFLGIWVSVDYLFAMMSKGDEYILGKYVIFFLGCSKLIDMLSGVNSQIIGYSKYFRYQTWFILCLAVFNVAANLLWIPIFQINGAALATLSSLFLFNLLKFILIKRKYNMHPFSIQMLWVFLIALLTWGIVLLIPDTSSNILTIVINSLIVTLVFGGLVLYFKLSTDINELAIQGFQKVRQFLKI